MKSITQIDSAGRLVIPKEIRKRYGFESGQKIRIITSEEGVILVPERPERRFVKRGPLLTIDTGGGIAPLDVFNVSELRESHLKDKNNENRS